MVQFRLPDDSVDNDRLESIRSEFDLRSRGTAAFITIGEGSVSLGERAEENVPKAVQVKGPSIGRMREIGLEGL